MIKSKEEILDCILNMDIEKECIINKPTDRCELSKIILVLTKKPIKSGDYEFIACGYNYFIDQKRVVRIDRNDFHPNNRDYSWNKVKLTEKIKREILLIELGGGVENA
jgi:hypothetical protein